MNAYHHQVFVSQNRVKIFMVLTDVIVHCHNYLLEITVNVSMVIVGGQ